MRFLLCPFAMLLFVQRGLVATAFHTEPGIYLLLLFTSVFVLGWEDWSFLVGWGAVHLLVGDTAAHFFVLLFLCFFPDPCVKVWIRWMP